MCKQESIDREPGRDGAERLFEQALRVAGVAREELLERESRRHPGVVAEVRSLLEAHGAAGEFLEEPAFAHLVEDRPVSCEGVGRCIGPYRIEFVLGRGGMGTVYQAVRECPRKTVALKVLKHPSFAGPERRARFRRKAQALAHLQHAGIATLYETGSSPEGVPYIAMELVRGLALDDWARERRPDRTTLLHVFVEICEAVEYAHGAGVIHRDLKPANVIVRKHGERPRVKVLDLGLAHMERASGWLLESEPDLDLTRSGSIVGTPSYSSPEQISGQVERVGVASDVYSLGVILYELLTGRLPHGPQDPSLFEGIRTVCEEEPVRPSSLDRTLRGDLETILLRALEKDPARRYPSVRAIRTDLELHLAGQPILARPPSARYRPR